MRQGPHQVAHRFTITPLPRRSLRRISPSSSVFSRKSGARLPSFASTLIPGGTNPAGISTGPYLAS